MFPNDEPTDPVSSQPSAEAQDRETEDKIDEALEGGQSTREGSIAGFLAVSPGAPLHAFRVEPGFSPQVALDDLRARLGRPGNTQIGYAVCVDASGEAWLERVLLAPNAPPEGVAQAASQG